MKYLVRLIIFFSLMLIASSCLYYDVNTVKIKNELNNTLIEVSVGNLVFNNIGSGETSSSQDIEDGEHLITGVDSNNNTYSKTEIFVGRYLEFTVTFQSDGSIIVSK